MALKKPSDYFKKEETNIIDQSIQILEQNKNLDTFSQAFNSFKDNLQKIENISDLSEVFDNYSNNLEKVDHLSDKVEKIDSEISSYIKKEELDRAMMSQLLVVEKSIQDKINSIKILKKPSDYFTEENVEEFFQNKNLEIFDSLKDNLQKIENISDLSEIFDNYKDNIEKVNVLSNKIEEINLEINSYLKKEELDKVMMSQLLVVEQSIRDVQNKVKSINEETLYNIISDVSNLTQVVNEFIEVEVPTYKKLILDSEIRTSNRFVEFKNDLKETIDDIESKSILSYEEYQKTLEEYGEINDKKYERIVEQLKQKLRQFKEVYDNVKTDKKFQADLNKKVSNLEIEIIRNESHLKIQNKNLEKLQDDIKDFIGKINLEEIEAANYKLKKKIKNLEEIFDKFNEKQILRESIIVEPPSTKNSDPLTPLDKNYVTIEQLQDHYRLFINRIQQQIATIGGGGETKLKYLDDIVGIATNPTSCDGKFLKYDHSLQKFVFETPSGSGTGTDKLVDLNDVDSSNLSGISTDYLMVYDTSISGFKFVDPKTYFGINNDFNPSVDIDDFGTYT